MGMGDSLNKIPYRPESKPIRCDITRKQFYHGCVRKCRDEAVVRRYGVGGECNVSVWVCGRCRHAVRYPFHGGLGCELDRPIPEGEKDKLGRHR